MTKKIYLSLLSLLTSTVLAMEAPEAQRLSDQDLRPSVSEIEFMLPEILVKIRDLLASPDVYHFGQCSRLFYSIVLDYMEKKREAAIGLPGFLKGEPWSLGQALRHGQEKHQILFEYSGRFFRGIHYTAPEKIVRSLLFFNAEQLCLIGSWYLFCR